VPQDAVPDRFRQIEAVTVVLQSVDQSQALLVVAEPIDRFSECPFPGVAEGCVTQVMTHADGFN
jgi:hypothetical protein